MTKTQELLDRRSEIIQDVDECCEFLAFIIQVDNQTDGGADGFNDAYKVWYAWNLGSCRIELERILNEFYAELHDIEAELLERSKKREEWLAYELACDVHLAPFQSKTVKEWIEAATQAIESGES